MKERVLSRKKKILFTSIIFLVFLFLLNVFAWFLSPKDSVFWSNPLMMIYPVDEFDQNVTIEHYNFNAEPNRPVRYVPDQKRWYRLDPEPLIPEDGQLVLNFGDSSTWGWGLSERRNAYPFILDAVLPDEVHSINLGIPGYSSLQGLRYIEELVPKYHQRIVAVTLYFGNNDSTENGSSDADKVKYEKGNWVKAVRWFALGRVIHNGIIRFGQRNNQMARVNPEEYEFNLKQIIAFVRSYGIRVVLIEPKRNFWHPPGHLTHLVSLKQNINNGWVADELESAQESYSEGIQYMAQRSDQCIDSFQEAINHDWVLPRLKSSWLESLVNVSRISGVTYIKLPEPFVETEYAYVFEDYCHPSTYVHAKIANEIKTTLGYK